MIRVALYGNNKVAQITQHVIEKLYNPKLRQIGAEELQIVTFIINDRISVIKDNVYSLREAIEQYKQKRFDLFLVPIDNYIGNHYFIHTMIKNEVDINAVFLCSRMEDEALNHMESFLMPYLSAPYLGYLEYHVADQCNLNCRACEHYSGLVEKEKYPIFEEFKAQFEQLRRFVSDIGIIRILGGEPLMNPEVERYVRLTRELYPKAIVGVVTNALLLKQMPESFWDAMRETDTHIMISYYPPLQDKMEEIKEFIEGKGVKYAVSDLITYFTKKQVLEPQSDRQTEEVFYDCVQARCNNLYEGKLAPCFLPFTTCYFNEYYRDSLQEPLPEDGTIDLYQEGLTLEEIKLRLLIPFERCRYCSSRSEEIPWGQISKPSPVEDWIKTEG